MAVQDRCCFGLCVTVNRKICSHRLSAAMRAQDVEQIVNACKDAKAAGVSQVELERGVLMVKMLQAKRYLQESMRTQDAKMIEGACKLAHVAEVESSLIEEASEVVKNLRVNTLKEALRSRDLAYVEDACVQAERVRAPPHLIAAGWQQAMRILAELELVRAIEAGDAASVAVACRHAAASGVLAGPIERGWSSCRRLLEGEMSSAIRSESLNQMEAVCKCGLEVGISHGRLQEWHASIAQLRATQEVDAAVASGDAERVEEACRRAEGVGASPSKIDTGWAMLRQFRAAELVLATQSMDCDRIEEVCRLARRVGVADERVTSASATLRQLRAAQLTSALHSGSPDLIESSCAQAARVGVSHGRVEEGQLELRRLRADAELISALDSNDQHSIESSCRRAETAWKTSYEVVARIRKLKKEMTKAPLWSGLLSCSLWESNVRPFLVSYMPPASVFAQSLQRVRHAQNKLVELVLDDLQSAMKTKDAHRIEALCVKASSLGAASKSVVKGLAQARDIRKAELMMALNSSDIPSIEAAFRRAEFIGVTPNTLQEARARLSQLRVDEELSAAFRGLSQTTGHLAGQVWARLEIAVQAAEAARLGQSREELVTNRIGKSGWVTIRRFQAERLTAAMRTRDADRIEEACEGAARWEIASGRVEEGRQRVRWLRSEDGQREGERLLELERSRQAAEAEAKRREETRRREEEQARLAEARRQREEKAREEEQRQRALEWSLLADRSLQEESRQQREMRRDIDQSRTRGERFWRCLGCRRAILPVNATCLRPEGDARDSGYSCRSSDFPQSLTLEIWKPRFEKARCICGYEVGAKDTSSEEFCLKAGCVACFEEDPPVQPTQWKHVAPYGGPLQGHIGLGPRVVSRGARRTQTTSRTASSTLARFS